MRISKPGLLVLAAARRACRAAAGAFVVLWYPRCRKRYGITPRLRAAK